MRSKECNEEGCTNPVWSKGVCKNHTERKPIKKERVSIVERMKPWQKENNNLRAMHNFFMTIWKTKPHYSQVSGVFLGKEPMSTYFHHILPKSKYPDAALDTENIVLLTAEEHENVENDMYKYDFVNDKREDLLKKYDLI